MLRVAHVVNAPGWGGVPRVAHGLIRATDRDRFAPHLFHLRPAAEGAALPSLDCPVAAASGAGGKMGALGELLDWLRVQRIDILHCHSFRPNLHARLAGAVLRPRLRIVAQYHNTYADKWADPQALGLERNLGAVTDARVAVSDAVAEHVAAWVGAPREAFDVVANGIDVHRLRGASRERGRAGLGAAPDDRLVGLVGRVCHQKGQDILVEAALAMLAADRRPVFVMVGDIEDRALADRLQARICAAGAAGRVRFVGHREDVGDVLAALDVLAAPSRWEGFGLAIAEAMWLGIPVVASAVDAIPAVTGGAATLVPPGDAGALATALRDVLARPPEAAAEAAEAGRAMAAGLTWEAAAARMQAVYTRIAECPSST